MKTIRIKLYKFDELNKAAKINAIESNRTINTDFDEWHELILEDITEKIQEAGFFDVEIQYSGFWSQGDGFSFDGKIDTLKFTENQNEKRIVKLIDLGLINDFEINKTSFANHYSHEKTRYVDFWQVDQKNINSIIEDLGNKIESKRLELCKESYSRLEKSYYELQSDEFVKETLIANEYDFTKDGKMY